MMTIRQMLSLVTIASLLSCSGKTGSEEDKLAESATDTSQASPEIGCFVYQMQKDSALLHLETAGRGVTGKLSYHLYEKDSNTGTLAGIMEGDTFIARYTFTSEGRESIREVAFLKTGSGWVEGFGDVKDSAGIALFKNRSTLNCEKGLRFDRVDCPDND